MTERKRYYVSNYGIENYIDIVNGKTNEIVKAPNFDRYYSAELIEWWRKNATKRYNKLKVEDRLRNDLEVWTPDSDIDITTGISNDRSTVYFCVCDSGPGIPEDEIEHLFQPFTQGDKARGTEGSGLGLAIIKKIVNTHGGDIQLTNREEGGLCAKVLLPIK